MDFLVNSWIGLFIIFRRLQLNFWFENIVYVCVFYRAFFLEANRVVTIYYYFNYLPRCEAKLSSIRDSLLVFFLRLYVFPITKHCLNFMKT